MFQYSNSGYNFICKFLKTSHNDLTSLLEYTASEETFFLEFKADIFYRTTESNHSENPRNRKNKNRENQDTYSWNVIEAIIALANTSGGAVIIGLADNGKDVVPLRDKDTDLEVANLDKYKRDLQTLLGKKSFSVPAERPEKPNIKYSIKNCCLTEFTEIRNVNFKGHRLLAVLVKQSEELIFFSEEQGNNVKDKIYRRIPGDTGENKELPPSAISRYNRPVVFGALNYYNQIPDADICFTGRECELIELNKLLSHIPRKIPVIHGPPGTGKTELAYKYAQIYRDKYDVIILLNASGSGSLPEIFCKITDNPELMRLFDIKIPETITIWDEKYKYIYDAMIHSGFSDILILLDDIDLEVLHLQHVRHYLSGVNEEMFHIYATCRTTRFNPSIFPKTGSVILYELKKFSNQEGLDFLEKKRSFDNEKEENAARKIVEHLDGNAWALAVIGERLRAQRRQYDDDYQEELKKLESTPLNELKSDSPFIQIGHKGHIDPIALLKPLLDKLSQEELVIAQISACCAPGSIYPAWLKIFFEKFYGIKFETDRQWERKEIISTLEDYHIVKKNAECFQMHSLTKLVLQNIYQKECCQYTQILYTLLINRLDQSVSNMELKAIMDLIQYGQNISDKSLIFRLAAGERWEDNCLLRLLYANDEWEATEKLTAFLIGLMEGNGNLCNINKNSYEYHIFFWYLRIKKILRKLPDALLAIDKLKTMKLESENEIHVLCFEADILCRMRNFDQSESILIKIRDVLSKLENPEETLLATVLETEAFVYFRTGKIAEAVSKMDLCLQIRRASSDGEQTFLTTLLSMAEYCIENKELRRAELLVDEVVAILPKNQHNNRSLRYAHIHMLRAQIFYHDKMYKNALVEIQKAIEIHQDRLPSGHNFLKNDFKLQQKIIEAVEADAE